LFILQHRHYIAYSIPNTHNIFTAVFSFLGLNEIAEQHVSALIKVVYNFSLHVLNILLHYSNKLLTARTQTPYSTTILIRVLEY
jgi:hypothetical protein